MTTPLMLLEDSLENTTDTITGLVKEIQDLIGPSLTFDQKVGIGTFSGSPNNLSFSISEPFNESATLIPGIPAVTVTPEIPATTITPVIPAVMSPAVPGVPAYTITGKVCLPWGMGCTPALVSPAIPGVPAYTITPTIPAVISPTVPAVITPAIPATTASVSGSLTASIAIKGLSDALTPILESTKLNSTSISGPNDSGLAEQVTEWLSSGTIEATDLDVSATAGWEDLKVTVAGVTTNLGSVNLPLMSNDKSSAGVYLPLPSVSGSITTSLNWPSFNETNQRTRKNKLGVIYDLFPQTSNIEIKDVTLNPGESIIATALDSTLGQLDNYWNRYVCGAFNAVGLGSYCLESPTESLVNDIADATSGIDDTFESQLTVSVNQDLASSISELLPYTQSIAAATWNSAEYPIVPSGNYIGASMKEGNFSGLDISAANFTNADLSFTDFSNAILTGAIFDGANLTGANFSGASGQPIFRSSRKSQRSAKALESALPSFEGAALFGANIKGSDLDLSGALIDSSAKTNKDFDADNENVTVINPYQMLLSNDLLKHDAYAESPLEILDRLAGNFHLSKEKVSTTKGALSLFNSGNLSNDLSLDKAKEYLADLPEKLQEKLGGLTGSDLIEGVSKAYVNWAIKDRNHSGTRSGNVLTGLFGDDNMSGGHGADKLIGGQGSDIIDGGKGDDKLKGGGDDDTFKLSTGNDIVTDFKIKDFDSIDLSGVRHAHATDAGKDTIITTEIGSMTLKGVSADSLESLYKQALENLDLYQPIFSPVPVLF
jgi:hypothetical protein